MQKAINFNGIAIVSVKGNDYRTHFWYMSKDDATNIMKKFWFRQKKSIIIILFYLEDEW